jgi:hypothetical protein
MLAIEHEFVGTIYALYFLECLHWLKPGEIAFTGRSNREWKPWQNHPGSFTLLGRMPVLRSPFDLRPGWIVFNQTKPQCDSPSKEQLDAFIRAQLPSRYLTVLAVLEAFNLLVLLPAILSLGLFPSRWLPFTVIVLVIHIAIACETYIQAKPWRMALPKEFWREYLAILLNPLAAVRCGDLLSRYLFGIPSSTGPEPAKTPNPD